MATSLEQFYLSKDEVIRDCLVALRAIILSQDPNITAEWKYGMPFFCYKGKMFCYLWTNKISGQPYIGFVEGKKLEHPDLIQENRARMKIMLFDPHVDLPVETIGYLLQQALDLYTKMSPRLG